MSDRRDIPVHLYGRPYDFDACGAWPECGCLRACAGDVADRSRRARRRFRLLVIVGCVAPTLYAAFLFLSQWSAS